MALTNSILVSYEKRSFIHSLPSSLIQLKKTACSKFSLDSSISMIIQSYNESWGEYIDIFQDDELIPGCKYRIILPVPSILYVESSSDEKKNISSDMLPQDLLAVNTFDSCESSSLKKSSELNEHFSSAESNSGLEFLQSVHFSSCLNEALKEKISLSRALRAELVNNCCKSITVNTKYPSSIMITDAARKIVRDYPHLKESIGTGYGGWRQAIRDKLKNMRRFDQSQEVQLRKKTNKLSSKVLVGKQADINISSETVLGGEYFDRSFDLNDSFITGRKEMVEGKMKICILKTKFPTLFSKLEFEKEFLRVTGKRNLFQYIPKFVELYREKLYTLLIDENKLPAWARTVKCLLDGSDWNAQVGKELLVLITLPAHFYEDQLALNYPLTVTESFLKGGSASPHLAIVGLETNCPKFYVLVEHQIILQPSTLSEALAVLVASYFIFHCEYPKQWKKTLLFLEKFIFDIHSKSSKMPMRVVNFVQKLKNI